MTLADDENPDPDIFEYTVIGLLDNETYFFAVKTVEADNIQSAYSAEEATLCITCAKLYSCETPPTGSFYVNDEPGPSNYGPRYTVRGRADANAQVTLLDQYGHTWARQADSGRNWSVADLDFEALYGKRDQLITFSVESGNSSSDATAIYHVTDPESSVTAAASWNGYISVTWSGTDIISGVSTTELWHKPPGTAQFTNTGQARSASNGTFFYNPRYGDGIYYFATRSLDKAGNWEDEPDGDGDTWIYYTAPAGSPGSRPDGYSGIEGGGGGCFIDTIASP